MVIGLVVSVIRNHPTKQLVLLSDGRPSTQRTVSLFPLGHSLISPCCLLPVTLQCAPGSGWCCGEQTKGRIHLPLFAPSLSLLLSVVVQKSGFQEVTYLWSNLSSPSCYSPPLSPPSLDHEMHVKSLVHVSLRGTFLRSSFWWPKN